MTEALVALARRVLPEALGFEAPTLAAAAAALGNGRTMKDIVADAGLSFGDGNGRLMDRVIGTVRSGGNPSS